MHSRSRVPLLATALGAALGALSLSGTAAAWQEAHQTAGDVTLEVGVDGVASVHDVIRWQVTRGPLHWIDLENVDPATALDAAVTVTSDDGRTLGAHVAPLDARALRVTVDDPRAFDKGAFTFDIHWRADWVKTHALTRDGDAWRVSWASPLATDGLDSVRTTLVLPPARVAPAPLVPDTGAVDDTALATLRREPTHDVLELVRPHVGKGDAVRWTVRVDPSALPAVVDPRLRPVPAPPPPEPDRVRGVCAVTGLAALALAFALLVAHKQRAFAAACGARGARPSALLPLPDRVRPAAAGALLALGVALQATDAVDAGSLLVACAMLVAAFRPPAARWPVRGPGRWLVLKPGEAFARPPAEGGDWLDASTPAGRRVAAAAALLTGVAVAASRHFGALAPWLVGLDAAVLMPVFLTGRVADLPPDGPRASARWLAPVFARLHARAALRVAPWARVAAGPEGKVDELRLLVLPRASIPGFVAVEVGRAWSTSPAGWAASPEVLVRVLEGSSAAAKLARELPRARMVTGRRADERVVRLRPRAGTRASTVALTQGLADALTDRRAAGAAPGQARAPSVERRVVRAPAAAQAPAPALPVRPAPMASAKAC